MVELQNVSVSRPQGADDASTVLHDVTLSIRDGEWLMLAGPNGSGKTTLLLTIAGLLAARSGRVRWDGAGNPGTVALLLQEPDDQFVAGSVRSELVLSLPPRASPSERRRRLECAVEQFSLAALLDRNPHRLSGGEKQRLAFATVWLSSPRLLLLDEPTSYLDAFERERCIRFVDDLNRGGVSVVWATPTVADLPATGRLVYLDGGRIEFDGRAQEFNRRDEPPALTGAGRAASGPRAGASPAPVALLRSVRFAYDDRPVFDGLSLELGEGEHVTVTGRNGAGKSTLLGLLGGVLEPSGGAIYRRYARSAESGRQNTFYLFQNPERLFFAETVYEEIAFGLKALGIRGKEISLRAEEALSRVGLDPARFRDRIPFSLSLGEMRRLAFAITLALDPRFLLLDEPASCLDAPGWTVLSDLLDHFADRAVVLATHDAERVSRATDRVIELPAHRSR